MDDNSKPVTNLLYLGRSSELRIQIERSLHRGSRFEYFDNLDGAYGHLLSKNCGTEIVVISDLNDLSPLGVLLKIKKAQRLVPIIVLSENKKSSRFPL